MTVQINGTSYKLRSGMKGNFHVPFWREVGEGNFLYSPNPSLEQEAMILSWLETCRLLYNRCLRDLKNWINSRKCSIDSCSLDKEYIMSADIPFPNYLEHKRQLTQWKKNNIYLKDVYSQTTQDVVKRMHNTWEAFKRRGYGFPRFVRRSKSLV